MSKSVAESFYSHSNRSSYTYSSSRPIYAPVHYAGLPLWKQWLRIYVPFGVTALMLAAVIFGVVYTVEPRLTYFNTALATIFAVLLSYSLGQAVSFFTSKTICVSAFSRRAKPMTVDDLHWWITLANRTVRMRGHVMWLLITLLFSGIVGLLTSSFNTFITPRFLSLSTDASGQTELDFTNPAFNTLYSSLSPIGCNFWPMQRFMSPSCAFSNAFSGMLQSGRSAFESNQMGLTSFARVSSLNMNGSVSGVIPFTSLNLITDPLNNPDNSINQGQVSTRALKQIRGGRGGASNPYNLTMSLQGLSASVLCAWSDTSPVVSTFAGANIAGLTRTTTTSTCDPSFNLTQYTPNLRVTAASCPSDVAGTTNLYIKHFDYYRHLDPVTGVAVTENLTCTVRPYLTNTVALYSSSTATTSILSTTELTGVPSSLQPMLDSLVDDIVHGVNNVGQTASNNLVAEAVVQLVTAYYKGDNTKMALVWSDFLRGMIEFDAVHARHVWEAQALNASNGYPARTAFRTVQATLSYSAMGWQSSVISLFTLAPIIVVSAASIIFLISGALIVGPLSAFCPTDPSCIILAAASGDLPAKLASDLQDVTSLRQAERHLERIQIGVDRGGSDGMYKMVAIERRKSASGSWRTP